MTIEDVFRKICEEPENDEARFEYADLIEASDPARSALIRIQLASAEADRRGELTIPSNEEQRLLALNQARWAHDIAKLVPRGDPEFVAFHRGFPAEIRIDPRLFAEYADLLFRLAPIRHVTFETPLDDDGYAMLLPDGERVLFPMDVVVACPQLARLDSIAFDNVNFVHCDQRAPGDIKLLATCPYLTQCLQLNFRTSLVLDDEFVELAEGPLTGKMLVIEPRPTLVGERRIEAYDDRGRECFETVFDDRWRDLERRLGYVPWLHPSHNAVSAYDARWFFEHGKLPKYSPGSPPKPEWYDVPLVYPRSVGW